ALPHCFYHKWAVQLLEADPVEDKSPVSSRKGSQAAMEPYPAVGCVNIGSLTSTLPVIPCQKLTDLYYLSRGASAPCSRRSTPTGGPPHRNSLLKEAEKDTYPVLAWPLRLRILYEIALGVNFLHNMNPPLLHHDLKTQNILMDGEFHVKIADFGLSKWRQLSVSRGSGSKPTEMVGTVIYMPPEKYEPSKSRRADVTNVVQIMFSVLRGMRPDTGEESLPPDIPNRETLITLMTCGWTTNPDERPSFLKCLIELEPMVRTFDEIDFLEAVLEIKSCGGSACCPAQPESSTSTSTSCSGSSQDTDISVPGALSSSNMAFSKDGEGLPSSFIANTLEAPASLRDQDNNLNSYQSAKPMNDLNIPVKLGPPATCCPIARWIEARREEIVLQMTVACLNQSCDALLSHTLLMQEDYELIMTQSTRTAKDFCRIVVRKLRDNKQNGLQPYPLRWAPPPSPPLHPPSAPLTTSPGTCSSHTMCKLYTTLPGVGNMAAAVTVPSKTLWVNTA
ncbi:hypothetical protein F7725_011936, partial [Dissostichus mawsoni]